MPAAKKVDLEKAAKQATERANKLGPFVTVRAIARGQYGYPYAKLVEPGETIRYYVKDLSKPKAGEHPMSGVMWKTIAYEGKEYGLPSWVVDANDPVVEQDDEELVAAVSGRPVKRGGSDEESDDVL